VDVLGESGRYPEVSVSGIDCKIGNVFQVVTAIPLSELLSHIIYDELGSKCVSEGLNEKIFSITHHSIAWKLYIFWRSFDVILRY
jgi:hypothetical protein